VREFYALKALPLAAARPPQKSSSAQQQRFAAMPRCFTSVIAMPLLLSRRYHINAYPPPFFRRPIRDVCQPSKSAYHRPAFIQFSSAVSRPSTMPIDVIEADAFLPPFRGATMQRRRRAQTACAFADKREQILPRPRAGAAQRKSVMEQRSAPGSTRTAEECAGRRGASAQCAKRKKTQRCDSCRRSAGDGAAQERAKRIWMRAAQPFAYR